VRRIATGIQRQEKRNMPTRLNPWRIALLAAIVGASLALLMSSEPWNTDAGISARIGELVGGAVGAAIVAGLIIVARNSIVFRRQRG
jgi:hypothetical protein